MISAPIPDNEKDRLAALEALDVLDTAPEEEFNALVRIASAMCDVPVSLISLVDAERQWFKANVGLGASETPRNIAFCAHAILGEDIFEVPDTLDDVRFSDNPLVTEDPDIRFYAGAPIVLRDGNRVGTLCVIDRKPKQLNDTERSILRDLAAAASAALEGRRAVRQLGHVARQLQSSEEQLRRTFELTPVMLHSIDANGRLLSVSDTWLSKMGYTRDEVIGKLSTGFLTLESQNYAKRSVLPEFFKSGRCDNIDYQMVTKDGTVLDVVLSAILEYDLYGQPMRSVSVIEDVTKRRIAESRLREKQQRLAHIIDSTQIGTWEWNVQTGDVMFNERWANIVGQTLEDITPLSIQTWIDLVHPDDLKRSGDLLERHFADQNVRYECEVRMRHRGGNWVWVRSHCRVMTWTSDGKPEWMFGSHEDITERIVQRQALITQSERASLATDSGGIGIWDLDLATNALLWDAWMYKLYGLEPNQEVAAYGLWIRHLHPDDIKFAEEALKAAVSGEKPFDTEFRIVWNDGTVRNIRATGRVTRNAYGRPLRMVGANWDVTEARRLNSELAMQHELLEVTLRSIGDAVITTDNHGNVTWLNPVAERMTGWLVPEAMGKPLGQVFHIINEETRHATENPALLCLDQGKIVGLANHTLLISRDGNEFGIEDSAAPIRSAKGELLGVVLVFHDVTEQRRLSSEMSFRASHDVLTGLVNRMEFEARLNRVLQNAHNDRSEHFLLYIDLDQFKLVNDSCGHAIGDQLLQQVSKLLASSVRDRDTLARLGGDEFAVILEHCTAEPAQRVASQICERMDDFRFIHDGRRFRIGASIGLVPVDSRWVTTEPIMQAADTSCYAAKEAGRNRVHAWFDSDLAMRTRHGEMKWTDRIGKALDEELFVLFAQRIMPIAVGHKGVHAEVLLRMVDTDGTYILPGAFFPAAERFHLASRIDRWVVRHAIDWMRECPSIESIETLSINLSGQSVGDRSFHRWAGEQLREAGPAICQKLCIEITETAAVTNLADAAIFIDHLRAAGVKVALDDFGAGTSSFGYLKSLSVDYLKIDGQFVRDMVTDPLDEEAVRCFTNVARVVGVKTVAEFVESQEILDRLRSIGVDFAQGFLLHEPAPLNELLTAPDLISNCD
ncbi:diguanylate cyclase (GGDEF)-like protein/PAS domain S-box-containing protein [Oxalobacteraceae bacterium GrIS 2.11]